MSVVNNFVAKSFSLQLSHSLNTFILDNPLLTTFSSMKELCSEVTEREQLYKFVFQNNKGHRAYLNGILLLVAAELNYSSFPKFRRDLHNRKNIKLAGIILIFMSSKKRLY